MEKCSCCGRCSCRVIRIERGPRGKEGPPGKQGPPGIQGPEGPPGFLMTSHGYAYSQSSSNQSGYVKFTIAGPLQDVELLSTGLKILKQGIYQIQYKVIIVSCTTKLPTTPASFQVMINEEINVLSSLTESTTSNTLNSSQLFSLLDGDIVRLHAELPEGFSYKLVTLQVIQIG